MNNTQITPVLFAEVRFLSKATAFWCTYMHYNKQSIFELYPYYTGADSYFRK